MGNDASLAFLGLIALFAANLPFLAPRILFVAHPKTGSKGLGWRLLEMLLMYFAVGALALWLEARQGQIYPQRWEFYAVTFFVFVVLGYPGFVYRYLWQKK
ncbi:MAG: DUF2818 family protein [Betaproteobacteria bacterium]|nr:DUF2818 family protein [Betaproteobacteria bacterium]